MGLNVTAKSLREDFPSLFQEFLKTFPDTPSGRTHTLMYTQQRQTGQQNYADILAASDRGEDITDLVLLKLIPHTDSANHRASGAWIHIAPCIAGDIKTKFEASGWTQAEAWPQVAKAFWQLVRRCQDAPEQLATACAEFQQNPITKGFQAGMVTPILNALRPDDFLLINHKSRSVINGLANTNYGQKLTDYAAINATGKALIEEWKALIQQPDRPNLRNDDLFDMFCHWFVAVKPESSVGATVRYWKISPGEQAWQWPEACAEGFIGLGWEEMGDVSGLDQSTFAARREAVITAQPHLQEGWSKAGLNQLWQFAQIQVGDRIIANRGTQQILGIGTVTRPYYFRPDVRQGHRVDVEWDDLTPRSITEPSWVKTLCSLTPEQFHSLSNAPVLSLEATEVADGNKPGIWWVNQGKTLDLEKAAGYITAPVQGQDGRKVSHWESLSALKVGDIVVHYRQGLLQYVSRVTTPAWIDRDGEDVERRFVQLDYQPLHPPVPVTAFIDRLIALDLPASPIQNNGKIRQGYLFPLTEAAFSVIRDASPDANWAEIDALWDDQINLSQQLISNWIFQANPNIYDLPGALEKVDSLTWVVRQHQDKIHAGDRVFLWEAGANAGVLAAAEILTEPDILSAAEIDKEFRRNGGTLEGEQLRVRVRILHRFNPRITKASLLAHPVLSALAILRSPQGTNFPVTPEQARALMKLLKVTEVSDHMHSPGSEIFTDIEEVDGQGPLPIARPSYEPPTFEAIVQHVQTQKLCLSDRTLRRYHLALQTRGFVILSGVSGTGKTWLTEVYAKAVGAEYCLVAVAPNWTSNEDLLGYWNPCNQVYHDTAFSRFLAAAAAEYHQAQQENRVAHPYHLVLDEMNLARVEYYFARFLSAMEVRQRYQIATIDLAPGYQLTLPPNLAFIGTVNVDETTHNFADKVYDRAQLIELGIDRPLLENYLDEVAYRDTLLHIWDALHPVAPFAFRVVSEIKIYITEGEAMAIPWSETLDEQLVQKILPKLRGMDQRVGQALENFLAIARPDTFPLSHQKAQKMHEMWIQHGIVSYF